MYREGDGKVLGGGWKFKGQEKKDGAKSVEAESGIRLMCIWPEKAKKKGKRGGREVGEASPSSGCSNLIAGRTGNIVPARGR